MTLLLLIIIVSLIYLLIRRDEHFPIEQLLPTNGFEPKYDPEKWNQKEILSTHNCYDYAFNNYNPDQKKRSQPGKIFGGDYTCPLVETRLVSQHLNSNVGVDIISSTRKDKCPNNYYKIALLVDDNDDYHFVRQDSGGGWSHKSGKDPVTNRDYSGHLIFNPETADMRESRFNYKFCSYFCVSTDAFNNL